MHPNRAVKFFDTRRTVPLSVGSASVSFGSAALSMAFRFDMDIRRGRIRNGTGVGVGASQYDPRRGIFFGISKSI